MLNSELYAVGGYGDDGGRVKNVERYNEEKNVRKAPQATQRPFIPAQWG